VARRLGSCPVDRITSGMRVVERGVEVVERVPED
jgi:hypothetical protein